MADPPATAELAAAHGLTADEYARIVALLGRPPGVTELGLFQAMWSEHCSYKSSRVHLARLPTAGPHVLQGPGENAGAVAIGDGLAAVFKIESHNHPSFIEPYQGAATGVGGILRDVFTMGARPVALLDSLRFGPPDAPRMRYLIKGVVSGIGGYGNAFGCPTVGGEVGFEASYAGNILVNAFCLGVAPVDRLFRARAAGVGNPVVYVGSKTGRDGIHGATMASAAFGADPEGSKRPTVQVGDPFAEKLLLEACLELMAGDAIVAIQDMGAAGLTSASAEMAARGGTGIELDLDRVPLREAGMTPYEIMLSESQERMLLVARAGREEEVARVFAKWDLEAVVVGRVTGDGRLRVRAGGRVVADVPVAALTSEAPVYRRPAAEPRDRAARLALDLARYPTPDPQAWNGILERLLTSPGLCSREWVWRQYDWLVLTNTVVGPGSDAAVLRVKGTDRMLAIAVDGSGRYTGLDPYSGGALAVAEATRNVACAGARPLALTDCLNFGSPERPEIMWQFEQAIAGMADAARALGTPFVSGNVSFYNETAGVAIDPTPVVAAVGLLEGGQRPLTQAFRRAGDLVVVLGATGEDLGGSEYLKVIHGVVAGRPPALDLEAEVRLQRLLVAAAAEGCLASAHDCAEGGLLVALAEATFGGRGQPPLGAAVDLTELPLVGGRPVRPEARLVGETPSRVVASVPPERLPRLAALAAEHGVPLARIGVVGGDRLRVSGPGVAVDLAVAPLREAWRTAFARMMGDEVP
ncbi:MAG TPA: phosphoribosylformylglycinamidine synthase subunit PurL [Thermodesulfobacteriota bacterium]|nr:phosphoribosylformylglycinamidine synthase subunit PurL [Thermodesulfobacteriota bacterium]